MKVGVIGASGYLGAELLRLLAAHDQFEVASVQGDRSAGTRLTEFYPSLRPVYGDLVLEAADPASLHGLDVVFVAVPSGHSQAIVAALVDRVGCVVDLGADFRLRDAAAYETWYGFTHSAPELLERAVYGLCELNRDQIRGARLIAAPGCYVTAASLGLAPLVAAKTIEPSGIIVDGASGTSGAGRGPSAHTQHGAVNESFVAYGLLSHRHTPEIEQTIGAEVLFTPHLAPMTRGILVTCYAKATGVTSTAEVLEQFRSRYAGEPFVEVVEDPPATRDTYGSNLARLTARYDERTGHVVVLVAIDNLTKGGSGQAIQAANLAVGLDETLGLTRLGLVP
jgi:N-acetyl-gamma-glutamyl-phosphate reductase